MTGGSSAETQKETLQKVFGLTPDKAFNRLTLKKFVVGKDDTDLSGTMITELVDICFDEEPVSKETLCKKFFWNALPNVQERRNLQTLFKLSKTGSFEEVLDICRTEPRFPLGALMTARLCRIYSSRQEVCLGYYWGMSSPRPTPEDRCPHPRLEPRACAWRSTETRTPPGRSCPTLAAVERIPVEVEI